MHRLVYSSIARVALNEDELDALLGRSRARNEAAGLTGVLLHVTTHDPGLAAFVQLLEGDRRDVEDTYLRIAADELHTDLALLASEPAAGRAFADWSMRLERLSAAELAGPAVQAYPEVLAAVRDRDTVEKLLALYG